MFGLGAALYRRDKESSGSLLGSAIAFRLFLFFVPLLVFVVGLAGLIGRYADPDSITALGGVSGGLAAQIEGAFRESGRVANTARLSA